MATFADVSNVFHFHGIFGRVFQAPLMVNNFHVLAHKSRDVNMVGNAMVSSLVEYAMSDMYSSNHKMVETFKALKG